MKIISAHQPAYIPWLGYFHKILLCEEFVIMDDVQFEKNSFTNRNKVLANGNPVILTIPVNTKDYTLKSIREIELADDRWKIKHLRTIEQSYKKLPYFDEVFPFIEKGLNLQSKYFIDYSNYIFFEIVKFLDIKTPIRFASDLSVTSKKLHYVIELTKKLDGNVFVFGALGRNYADVGMLNENGIKAYFQDYHHPVYDQGRGEFASHLSIIDLLMRKGRQTLEILQQNNAIKQSLVFS
jgi:hypothetical protein